MTTNKLMHKMYESAKFRYISGQPGYTPLRIKLELTFFNMRHI